MGTIRDLNELTVPAGSDYVLVADTSDLVDKDKKMQLSHLAIKSGTPTAGHVATWLDANTVQDGGTLLTDKYLKNNLFLVDATFTNSAAAQRFTTIGAALAACGGGETILIAPGTYNETVTIGVDHLTLRGSGMPEWDGTNLVGGTIVTGSINCQAQVGINILDLGVDLTGKAAGINAIASTAGNVSVYRLFQNIAIRGAGQAAAAHGLYLFGHNQTVNNIIVVDCYHAIAVHGSYINISDVYSFRNYGSSLVIKAKSGIDVRWVNVSNYICQGDPSGATTLLAGSIDIQTANSQALNNINLSNITFDRGAIAALSIHQGDTTGTISDINVVNMVSTNQKDLPLQGDFRIIYGSRIVLTNCRSVFRQASVIGFVQLAPADVALHSCVGDGTGGGDVSGTYLVREINGVATVPSLTVTGALSPGSIGATTMTGVTTVTRLMNGTASIVDQAVATYSVTGAGQGILLISTYSGGDSTLAGIIIFRAAGGPFCVGLTLGTNTNVMTGALTGATGVNGKFTVSAHTDGNLYFENRRGATVNIVWLTVR